MTRSAAARVGLRVDGQHGATGVADDALRDRAEQRVAEPGAAVRPHDDQVEPALTRHLHDLDGGVADALRRRHARRAHALREPTPLVEVGLGLVRELLQHLRARHHRALREGVARQLVGVEQRQLGVERTGEFDRGRHRRAGRLAEVDRAQDLLPREAHGDLLPMSIRPPGAAGQADAARNSSRASSDPCRPACVASFATSSRRSRMTLPFENPWITAGKMYELLHTAGVFPSEAAVDFTAAATSFLRSVRPGIIAAECRASSHAHSSVPAQVRKSLAVNDEPMTSLMYWLMWRRRTSSTVPSSSRNLSRSGPGTLSSSLTSLAMRASCSSRTCRLPDLPG